MFSYVLLSLLIVAAMRNYFEFVLILSHLILFFLFVPLCHSHVRAYILRCRSHR